MFGNLLVLTRDRLRFSDPKTCVKKEEVDEQLKKLEEKVSDLQETEITSEYSLPDRLFNSLVIWPEQKDLRALIVKVPPNVPIEFTFNHGDPAPGIPQRVVFIDGFLKIHTLKIVWDKQGRPFPNNYKEKIVSETGYLTILPLQAASDTQWHSTNAFSHTTENNQVNIFYQDSATVGSHPSLMIQIAGADDVSGEELNNLIKQKKFNELKSRLMICK
jgi:hypothetical protein